MGRLTEEKISSIIRTFGTTKSYQETAKVEHTNWKTVKKHVSAAKEKMAESGKTVKSAIPTNGGDKGFAEIEREDTSPLTPDYTICDRLLRSRGPLAAAAFTHFRRGKGPVDVVMLLRIPPEEVEPLYEEFIKLEGGVYLPKEARENLDAFKADFNETWNFDLTTYQEAIELACVLVWEYDELLQSFKGFTYSCGGGCGETFQAQPETEWKWILEQGYMKQWRCYKCREASQSSKASRIGQSILRQAL